MAIPSYVEGIGGLLLEGISHWGLFSGVLIFRGVGWGRRLIFRGLWYVTFHIHAHLNCFLCC